MKVLTACPCEIGFICNYKNTFRWLERGKDLDRIGGQNNNTGSYDKLVFLSWLAAEVMWACRHWQARRQWWQASTPMVRRDLGRGCGAARRAARMSPVVVVDGGYGRASLAIGNCREVRTEQNETVS